LRWTDGGSVVSGVPRSLQEFARCTKDQRARKFRPERGLSQEELAFDCGLHRTYVSGVERGVRNPTVVVLEKIAKALKVAASGLLE
jgi:transcriptional regulator with XRE-family HTH domain